MGAGQGWKDSGAKGRQEEGKEATHAGTKFRKLARNGKATRDDLTGSTITITSLGVLGAIASTPIINHPEVAIVGINKMAIRPMWDGQKFQPRNRIPKNFVHSIFEFNKVRCD